MPRRKQQARRAADKSINWVEVRSVWWAENVLP
uniref:Teashirt zinc finger homeobox 3 n=1 Tax=Macaca fascicularis TaxID=9541 RepID=A0A2K5TL88_MACFA